jgi:pimeloyl-ACP methyl ester carboxylesterase
MPFRYLEWGSIDPPIVLLHGVMAAARSWEPIARVVGEKRRVLALDQRGHGESAHADDYDWERWVEDLDAFWRTLGLGRIALVGHSMGGGHAMRFAATHPDAVERLVLVDKDLAGMPARSASWDRFWASFAQLVPAEGFGSREEYLDVASSMFPRAHRQAIIETSDDLLLGPDGRWRWSHPADPGVLGLEVPDAVERGLIDAVRCPTLVVRAEHSEVLSSDGLPDLVNAFANAELAEVPDTGHIVMWENPTALAQLIEEFVARPLPGHA